jgi:hypothetical protein
LQAIRVVKSDHPCDILAEFGVDFIAQPRDVLDEFDVENWTKAERRGLGFENC